MTNDVYDTQDLAFRLLVETIIALRHDHPLRRTVRSRDLFHDLAHR